MKICSVCGKGPQFARAYRFGHALRRHVACSNPGACGNADHTQDGVVMVRGRRRNERFWNWVVLRFAPTHQELAGGLINEAEALRGLARVWWLVGLIPLGAASMSTALQTRSSDRTFDPRIVRRGINVGLAFACGEIAARSARWLLTAVVPPLHPGSNPAVASVSLAVLHGAALVAAIGGLICVRTVFDRVVLTLAVLAVLTAGMGKPTLMLLVWQPLLIVLPPMFLGRDFSRRTHKRIRLGAAVGLAMTIPRAVNAMVDLLVARLASVSTFRLLAGPSRTDLVVKLFIFPALWVLMNCCLALVATFTRRSEPRPHSSPRRTIS